MERRRQIGFTNGNTPSKPSEYTGWYRLIVPGGGGELLGQIENIEEGTAYIKPHIVSEPFYSNGDPKSNFRLESRIPLELPSESLIKQPVSHDYVQRILTIQADYSNQEQGSGI